MNLRRANRLLNALVLLAVLFLAGTPDPASAHPNDYAPTEAAVQLDPHDAPSHLSGEEVAGHCHPGLDCFTAAVFVMSVDITSPVVVTNAQYLTPFHTVDDVRPEMVLPPPRRLS